MAHVQKRTRADGATTYVVKWQNPDGKHRSKGGFTTKKSAENYATRVKGGRLTGIEYDPKAGAVAFREAAAVWLDSRHDLKPRTIAGYREMLAPANERRRGMSKLGIDAEFGGYPLNAINRDQISSWVQRLTKAGKKPSTVRHQYFVVRMVLRQAVQDRRIPFNPADNVTLPTERSVNGGAPGVVDDPAQFLTPAAVASLTAATPWPFNVYVHTAAWAGLRAGELCGLQVADVELPPPSLNPNAPVKTGALHVRRTVIRKANALAYDTPKTAGSLRRVPMTAATTTILRDYLAMHPRRNEPTAPLFPSFKLTAPKPGQTQRPKGSDPEGWRTVADRQARTLAALSVADAEARLVLDWKASLAHLAMYKAVFRPAVLRALRLTPTTGLSPDLKFHSLRHTYVSLCVAAGIEPLKISRFAGHSKVTTTLGIYAHLFEDDHADAMAALGAMNTPRVNADNVIPLRG
jgi:integrase